MRSDEGARRQQFNNRRDLLKRVFKEGIRGSPSSSQELRQLLQPQQQHQQRSRIILPQQQQQQQRSKIILPQQQRQQQELQRPQIAGQEGIISIPQQQHQRAQIVLPQAGLQPQGGLISIPQQEQHQQVVVPQLVRGDPIMPPPPPTPPKEPSSLQPQPQPMQNAAPQQPSVIVQQVNPPSGSDGVMATLQEVLNEGADALFPSTQVGLVYNIFMLKL